MFFHVFPLFSASSCFLECHLQVGTKALHARHVNSLANQSLDKAMESNVKISVRFCYYNMRLANKKSISQTSTFLELPQIQQKTKHVDFRSSSWVSSFFLGGSSKLAHREFLVDDFLPWKITEKKTQTPGTGASWLIPIGIFGCVKTETPL